MTLKFLRKENNDLCLMMARFALGSVFLWFGIDKWIHPEAWFGWVPAWAYPFMPGGLGTSMVLMGIVEVVIGLCLIAGVYMLAASAVAWLMLLMIVATQGANEVAVRDAGLLGIAVTVFIHANARARRPLPRKVVEAATLVTIAVIFVMGIAYLRAGK